MLGWGMGRCVWKVVCQGRAEEVLGSMSIFQDISVKQNIYYALIRYFCLKNIILTIQNH